MVKTTHVTEPYIKYHNSRLSEGITYNPSNNSLLWVDIIQGKINRVFLNDDLSYSEIETHKISSSLGVIGLTSNPDVYICGVTEGIGQFNFKTKEFKLIKEYPAEFHKKANFGKQMRSNDGSIDSNGDFWVGTMAFFDEEVTPVGKLYKYDSKTLDYKVHIDGVAISNGINWFGDYMYWTSSLEHRIYKFKYDYKTGTPDLSTKQVFLDSQTVFSHNSEFQKGEPDGSTMDQQGNLYAAVWGTNRVVKLNPKGEFVEEFVLPANRISCVTIGGPKLDQLFITTGDLHLDSDNESDLKSDPNDLGGYIFKVQLEDGTKGIEKNKWSGKLYV